MNNFWSSFVNWISQFFQWFIMISPWEQGLRVRLGKNVKILNSGWHFKIPFLDQIFKQSIRRRLKIIRPQTLTTLDGKVVNCSGAVGYEVTDLLKLYNSLEAANDTIENEVAAIITEFVGSQNLADCHSRDLEKYVRSKMHLSNYGLSGQEFYLTSFASSKTYRLITGEINSSWSHDSGINMAAVSNSSNNYL